MANSERFVTLQQHSDEVVL